MKWFKHDANANTDAKLEKLMIRHGLEGYGLYWFCLELIAQNVHENNLTFELEHDSEIIARRTGLHQEKVQEVMKFIVDLGLFESQGGVVMCAKLATRTDEYTSKLLRKSMSKIMSGSTPDNVVTLSGHYPDKVPPIRIEENRIESDPIGGSKNKFSEDDVKLCKFIYSRLLKLNQKMKTPNYERWANTIRLLREVDSHTHKEIQNTFIFANNDQFWKSNILSPDSLRKNFDRLTILASNQAEEETQAVNYD